MSDPTGQPTQEEIEAYYAQLREAPVGELLVQCIGVLAAGAEAKLGLAEARTLIDSMAALVQLGEPHLGPAAEQMKGAVTQLQMAQVQLERRAAEGGGTPDHQQEGQAPAAQGGPQGVPPEGTPPPSQSGPQGQPGAGRQTDKLWIPGR